MMRSLCFRFCGLCFVAILRPRMSTASDEKRRRCETGRAPADTTLVTNGRRRCLHAPGNDLLLRFKVSHSTPPLLNSTVIPLHVGTTCAVPLFARQLLRSPSAGLVKIAAWLSG